MHPKILTTLAAAALAAGCMDVDETVTIRKDGTGTFDVVYAVPERTITQIQGMLRLRERLAAAENGEAALEQPDLFTRILLCSSEDKIRELLGPYQRRGITIESLEYDSRNTGRNVKLRLAFTSLPAFAAVGLFPERELRLARTENGDYRLSMDTLVPAPQSVPTVVPESELARQLQPLLGGLRVTFKIRPPTDILQSNATRKAAQTATWSYEFDRDPRSLTALQIEPITLTFKGQGLSLPEVGTENKPEAGS